MTSPLITVLMPVYNAEPYLGLAIESILAQTYNDFEFLIINDGSTDNSREVMTAYSDPRIRLIDNEHNLGQTATLNRGLELAQGAFIARQDADDLSLPWRLEKQVAFLRNHSDIVLVGAQGYGIDETGRYLTLMNTALDDVSIRWHHLFDNSFIHSAVMFRKDIVWGKFRGYDESFSYCQDFELWSRILPGYPVANLPERLIKYRVHSTSMTAKQNQTILDENKRVLQCNLKRILGCHNFSQKEADFIYNYKFQPERIGNRPFMMFFRNLLETYQALYPAAKNSPSFRNLVAQQYTGLAFRYLSLKPGLALPALIRGMQYSPAGVASRCLRRAIVLRNMIN
jgi:glycosyltransferase involved in cell wall biosynthesis